MGQKDYKFGQKLRSQQKALTTRLKSRSERMGRIEEMRSSNRIGKSSSSYNFGSDPATTPPSSVNKKQDQEGDFKERFQSIMQKLDHQPKKEKVKKNSVKSLFRNKKSK